MLKAVVTFLLLIVCSSTIRAQEREVRIEWIRTTDRTALPAFKDAVFKESNPDLPLFVMKLEVPGPGVELVLDAINAEDFTMEVPESRMSEFPDGAPRIFQQVVFDRKRPYLYVEILPYYRDDFGVKRITSFNYSLRSNGPGITAMTQRRQDYKSSSVLSTGEWYKIGVPTSGMYKVDAGFLESLGMDPASVSPSQVHIYGQYGGMLPKAAGTRPMDDLEPLSLSVSDGGGPGFQAGDEVIFFAQGPDKWTLDSSTSVFIHEKHDYSDYKGYFLTISPSPQNLVNLSPPAGGTPTRIITEFKDFRFVEDELENLNKSGSLWLGDEFGIINERVYDFSFDDLIGEDAHLRLSLVGRSTTTSSAFEVSLNSSVLGTYSIGTVGSSYTSDVGRQIVRNIPVGQFTGSLRVGLRFIRPDFEATGWLDYIAVNVRRQLTFRGNPLQFRSMESLEDNGVHKYVIGGAGNGTSVWDVTDPFDVRSFSLAAEAGGRSFSVTGGTLMEFIAFEGVASTPQAFGKIGNQNLHALQPVDLVIVSAPAFLPQSEELAQIHRDEQGMEVEVVPIDQIFNEFSSGNPDVSAIRDFMKMLYDRGGMNPGSLPGHLLLFGDGDYDNRSLNEFELPSYQSGLSLKTRETYVSDDYFGLLDDGEGVGIDNGNEPIDIAIGRIPADSREKASIAVRKIRNYVSSSSHGDWRNQLTFVADDEDGNIHINDGNDFADEVAADYPVYNIEKIFLDAFNQESAASGSRYPDVNRAINSKMFSGTFIFNYVGHGGTNGLADERIMTFEDINAWDNEMKLPLFITATCEFTRYDDPDKYSAGERVFFKEDGGSIALVTTVRLVFSHRNEIINRNFLNNLFEPVDGEQITLGEVTRRAKNASNTGTGNRKFALIGDPALMLAYPEHRIVTTHLNGVPADSGGLDTLKALSKITIQGEVRNRDGQWMEDFNGFVYPRVYDKEQTLTTLKNDPGSNEKDFVIQKNILFSGKASVVNGRFSFEFIVPKDINYAFGNGKISYYASSFLSDAAGFDNDIVVGGTSSEGLEDDNGPEVDIFLGSEDFVFGGLTDESPLLIVDLFDESGINTSGTGIGHDITAILDEDNSNTLVLNDFYEGELDNFRAGKVRFPLQDLEPGRHTLRVKAWDVLNNSGEGFTEFLVAESAELALKNVLNYPNPFTTNTSFIFEHNRPGEPLEIAIQIFTVSGKMIKSIQDIKVSEGFLVNDIQWDGLDDYGDRIGRGVYVYKVSVKDSRGSQANEFQKLVLLR